MTTRKVRVRFAPSPTGPLHIGGVRTALFNYLFAKKHGGDFILRIEDTDSTRFVEGAEEYINESMRWLGMKVDEGVGVRHKKGHQRSYRQSKRSYKQYVDKLIKSGHAYYAFDTPESLEKLRERAESRKEKFSYDVKTRRQLDNSLNIEDKRFVHQRINNGEPYVVRFKMPEKNEEIYFDDLVRGRVHFQTYNLDDKVIYKSSDNLPTYHLANVTDDYRMGITHVIRGEEWLPSAPLHVMLYRALNWEDTMPQFAHLPLILKPTGKGKLSKRDGDKGGFPVFPLNWQLEDGIAAGYRESGYFPEAVVNLLALLGWNPGTEQELFSMDELIQLFSIERVNKSGARFDPDKARWFNQQHLVRKSNEELAKLFQAELKERGHERENGYVSEVVGLVKERVNFVSELWEQCSFFFEAPVEYDGKVVKKRWKGDVPAFMTELVPVLEQLDNWQADAIKATIAEQIEAKELGFGLVMNAFRLALVGGGFGPDLMTIAEMIGKEETIQRLKAAVENIR
ncbi:glutamate--tRNA ligase [Carboxylicivirga sediminis]|uniref:Glutamate--tRNA ligase n=1 Tax=Carboxylicivirga sediminis TaxID=2006564 RepID=A0A941IW58_9BACT|nr:glutamate--tRNA ligase [Carboxylicivirga sediminis]MBR8534448.1 glutamate--tRNA ligase [Carboxylicivirga sediminis]